VLNNYSFFNANVEIIFQLATVMCFCNNYLTMLDIAVLKTGIIWNYPELFKG